MNQQGLHTELARRVEEALGDQYRIDAELGRGGMGVVFRAWDRALLRPVALKVIHPELTENPSLNQRFLDEARVIARLRHGNVVAVHTAGTRHGILYYVMDEVVGETLRDLLVRGGPLEVEQALRIVDDVAAALEAAEAAGVVHRDIKPENILLEAATGRARLVDFGIACAVWGGEDPEATGATAGAPWAGRGTVMGTPGYMSPEQASGIALDARSDIYGLGVVLFEMLAGRPPFEGTRRAILSRQIAERPPKIDTLRAGLPLAVRRLVHRALEKVPEARWSGTGEFRRAIAAARADRDAGRTRRSRMAALLAGVAAVLLGLWGIPVFTSAAGTRGDGNALLVLPFSNLRDDPAADWLRDGAVNMLSLALGQWRDLQVVEPSRLQDLLAAAGTGNDAAGATGWTRVRALARAAGAGSVILGEFTAFDDSVHVVVQAYDVRSGRRLEAVARDGTLHGDLRLLFAELADGVLGLPMDGNAPSLARTGRFTRSLTAYREYLRGAEALGQWDLVAAERRFRAAIAADSAFGEAYFRFAVTRGWRAGVSDSAGRWAIAEAARLGETLPVRERRRIEAYRSLVSGETTRARRLYADLAAHDAGDAEAWYGLGDAWFHGGPPSAMTNAGAATQAYRAFRHALRIDPGFHLAYEHLVALLAQAGESSSAMRFAGDAFVAATPERSLADARLLARQAAVEAARDWVADQPELIRARRALLETQLAAGNHPEALSAAEEIRRLSDRRVRPLVGFLEARVAFEAGETEHASGRATEALALADPRTIDPASLPPDVVGDVLAGANVFAYRGDLERAARAIGLAAELRRSLGGAAYDPGDTDLWKATRLAELLGAAGGAGEGGDGADPLHGTFHTAQIEFLQGRYRDALTLLDGFDARHLSRKVFDSRWLLLGRVDLLRGMAYERLGEHPRAGALYRQVLTRWEGASPTLAPVVAAARAGLARLGTTAG